MQTNTKGFLILYYLQHTRKYFKYSQHFLLVFGKIPNLSPNSNKAHAYCTGSGVTTPDSV